MKYISEEREISIKELAFNIVYKWKSILLSAFMAAIVTVLINIRAVLIYKDILGTSVTVAALVEKVCIVLIVLVGMLVTIYTLLFLFMDTIKSNRDFGRVCSVPVIGCITNETKLGKVDKCIRRLNGIKYKLYESEAYKQGIAKNIEKVMNNEKSINIVVISSYSLECSENVRLAIQKYTSKNINISVCGDVDMLPDSIEKVEKSDYIVLAESQGKSKYYEIEDLMNRLDRLNKKVLGVVLTDVDAI